MKTFLFILILLSIAMTSFSQTYSYDRIITKEKGSDAFSFDNQSSVKKSGEVVVKDNMVTIGRKSYKITKQLSENLYKAKKCRIQFVYCNDNLAAVKVMRYAVDAYYVINEQQPVSNMVATQL